MQFDKEFKITFEEFMKISDQLRFLCWPASKLQEELKEYLFGAAFWDKLYTKIEKRELELKNNGKKDIAEEANKKTETLVKQNILTPQLEQLFAARRL